MGFWIRGRSHWRDDLGVFQIFILQKIMERKIQFLRGNTTIIILYLFKNLAIQQPSLSKNILGINFILWEAQYINYNHHIQVFSGSQSPFIKKNSKSFSKIGTHRINSNSRTIISQKAKGYNQGGNIVHSKMQDERNCNSVPKYTMPPLYSDHCIQDQVKDFCNFIRLLTRSLTNNLLNTVRHLQGIQ